LLKTNVSLSAQFDSSIEADLTDLTTSASEMRERDAPESTSSAIVNSSCRTKIVSLWSMHGHRRSHPYGQERISVMVRLRNAVMVVMLATGLAGCASGHWPSIAHFSIWHCDTCDDFPTPAYGPGYSMMPGTYTGPPTLNASTPGGAAGSAPAGTPVPSTPAGATAPSAPAATTTPPTPPTP
jgi:hypothetical protein